MTSFKLRSPGHGMDLNKALDGCDDKHATILLAHQPKAAKYALDTEHDIQLVLAGEFKIKILAFSIIYGNLYFSGVSILNFSYILLKVE